LLRSAIGCGRRLLLLLSCCGHALLDDLELDEAAAATNLATVAAAKTATDRARKLEADIAGVKARLAQPGTSTVGAVHPLGTALANLIGSAADVLTSWQQAIVALVFELCLVGMMVIYELLGHSKPLAAHQETEDIASLPTPAVAVSRSAPKPKPATPKPVGSVSRFIRENVSTAQGVKAEMRDLIRGYRNWCAAQGVKPIDLSKALDEVETLCRQIGVTIEVAPDQRV
jgi:hypothetical protein